VSRQTKRSTRPVVDRWATLNKFVREKLRELTTETGSAATGLVWFTLFTLANAKRDGMISGASERWLSKITGLARNTVSAALKHLRDEMLLEIVQPGTNRRPPTYRLFHLTIGTDVDSEAQWLSLRGSMAEPQRLNG
jgi:hypothetical protein